LKAEFGRNHNSDGFVKTLLFLDKCRDNVEIARYMESLARTRSKYSPYEDETLSEVLDRV